MRQVVHASLQALGAEIVAVFEGSSEHGGVFQTRQSYLAREIHWGFQFRAITRAAPPGTTRHEVDISRCCRQRSPARPSHVQSTPAFAHQRCCRVVEVRGECLWLQTS